MWLDFLQYQLYRDGPEPDPQYLQGVSVWAQSSLHFALFLWKGRIFWRMRPEMQSLSPENSIVRSSRRDTWEESSCPIFLIMLNEWTKHYSLPWQPLASAHGGAQTRGWGACRRPFRCWQRGSGKQQRETDVAVTPGYSPLSSPGGTWIPSRGVHLGPPRPGWLPHAFTSCCNTGQSSRHWEKHAGPPPEAGDSEGGPAWVANVTPPSWTHAFQLPCSSHRGDPVIWVTAGGVGWFASAMYGWQRSPDRD